MFALVVGLIMSFARVNAKRDAKPTTIDPSTNAGQMRSFKESLI
jgi:hypothetical protein